MILRIFAAALAALLLSSCGYIGDPLPPLANVPLGVKDLAAIQRGSRIIAHFTIPLKTTEGFAIPGPLTFDLRIGTAQNFEENEWASHARHIPVTASDGKVANYEIAASEWIGKGAILGVRVIAANGKGTGWSNFVVVPVIAAPATPQAVVATATAEGVRLVWRAPGANFRVLRKTDAGEYAVVADVPGTEWTDTGAEYGKRYRYIVQTIIKLEENKVAESEISEEVAITPEDKFPPGVPMGLRADAVTASIELAWDRTSAADLAGYRIYRAVGDGAFEKIAETSQVPTYSDRAVERGKTYRYAVSAVDRAGNESGRSGVVEAMF